MIRAGVLAWLLLVTAFAPAHAFDASSLWGTPDQRGDRLLSQGDAKAAAKTYRDPRRRAYAAARAGDFTAAARDLAPLDDLDAHYNRGNALARSGDLKGALAAYDEALKHDAHNADVRHNRDLVAKALEPPQDQQDPKAGDNQGGDQKDRGDQTDQNQDPSQDAGDSGQKGNTSQNEQGQQPKDGSNADQQAQGEQKPSPSGSDEPSQPNDASQGSDSAQRDPAQAGQSPQSAADEAEQAKRDAQAALASEQNARKDDANTDAPVSTAPGDAAQDGSARGAATLPQRTEAQLAQEQWLRRIPDDPGGLLRRKFQIEHLRREQQGERADEEAP